MEGEQGLRERMARLGIREEDIEEKFVRSQGPGGQNVNKTSTCVYLKHLPTGIEVKCQQERSQAQNREKARGLLADKIERAALGALAEKRRLSEKARRQKRRRSRGQKERMLEQKRRRSQTKRLRGRVKDD
jgi:protein subunit release factor B